MSKSMTPAEKNHDIYDKEMGAIVHALKHFRHLVEGGKFPLHILTDHKNLEYFKKSQVLNKRQHRWLQFLQRFNFTISYRPGNKSGKPDALSRRPDHRPEGGQKNRLRRFSTLPKSLISTPTTVITTSKTSRTFPPLSPTSTSSSASPPSSDSTPPSPPSLPTSPPTLPQHPRPSGRRW